MSDVGFARIIRTLLRKKVEKILNEKIEIGARHNKSHHVVYIDPQTSDFLFSIHPMKHQFTVKIHFNSENILEPQIEELIINEFATLLDKHGFDSLILKAPDYKFYGTSEMSQTVADIMNEFLPITIYSTTARDFQVKDSHHDFCIIPELSEYKVNITTIQHYTLKTFKTPTEAKNWFDGIREKDKYIDTKIEEMKRKDKDLYLRVNVLMGNNHYSSANYAGKVGDKYIRSEKSLDHLFKLMNNRIDKISKEVL